MHPEPARLHKTFLWAIFCLFFFPCAGFSRAFETPLSIGTNSRFVETSFTPHALTAAPLQAITICSAAAAVLNGDVKTPTPNSYLWQINSNGNWVSAPSANTMKDYITSSLVNNATGSVVYSLRRQTTTGGVIAYDSFYDVTVRPIRAVSNNFINTPAVTQFCSAGNPTNITGSTATGGDGTFSYQWQSSTDDVTFTDIAGATSKDYDPPVLNKYTYYRRVVTSGACTTASVSNEITFQVSPPPPPPSPVTSNVAICQGTSAVLTVSSPTAGLIYNWYDSPAKTTVLATGTSFTTPVLNASRSYYVEASNGTCGSTPTTIAVTVVPLPAVPQFAQSTVSVCSGSTTTITIQNAQSGVVYNWYSSATDANILHTGTSYTISNVTGAVSYYVQAVSTTGCSSSARGTVSLSVVTLPVVTVSSSGTSICPGTSTTLSASSSDAAAVISWYDAPTGGNLLAKGNTYTTGNLTSAKNYYVEATNATGCNSNGRVTVQVQMTKPLDPPVVTVGEVTSSSITFEWSAVSGATSYLVSTDNGLTYVEPNSGSAGLTHKVSGLDINQSVTIRVKALGANSCTLSDASAAVTASTIDNNNVIYVANNFTPNGDGNNDIVYVHGKNINTLSFYVYDQWGQLLFTSTDVSKGWDGYFKGSLMPVGVYVYYLKATMNNGAQLTKKGTITLLR
ncbi:gliding motility-associated C-terminal domain-containing protein [Mucilaginibacter gossypiicola]|uniref:Gliding motility-associated C-terminal domain-containing protein n=1 Tax=Mucilaginibacter gossypiicola TaxID=551995 RepID=A0A1H8TCH3_9SPHI|nr:gliding motility-associated C-terminal domain-containing protein [Mucilaginibacter gossypiicola]SEO88581.1 gliding motility-associated C-terminal domain-containing protein [Mucilaginibacter gossypiicola]